MGLKVIDRELQHHSQLLQFEFAAAEFRSVERRLIVISEQMFVVRTATGSGSRQKVLRQNYSCSQSRAVRTVAAFSNAIEAVAGSNDPGIRSGALQVLAEIFKDRRMFGGK